VGQTGSRMTPPQMTRVISISRRRKRSSAPFGDLGKFISQSPIT
jgi:hypothetical protein